MGNRIIPDLKNRDEILREAYDVCLRELYLNSEPSIDINDLIKEGFVDDEKNPLRERHLIEEDTEEEIIEDCMYSYGIRDSFHNDLEIIKTDLEQGPYTRESKYDIKQLPPLKDVIGEEHYSKVKEYLEAINKFYRHDHEYTSFRTSIYLGASPNVKRGDK
jgi:hypothetical protein